MRCVWGAHICLLSRYCLVYFFLLAFSSALINFVYLKCVFVLISKIILFLLFLLCIWLSTAFLFFNVLASLVFFVFCTFIHFHILDQMALCDSDLPAALREVFAYEFLPVKQWFLTVRAVCAQACWVFTKMVPGCFCGMRTYRMWK